MTSEGTYPVPGGLKIRLEGLKAPSDPPKGHPWRFGTVAVLMASDRPGQTVKVIGLGWDDRGMGWVVVERTDGQTRAVPVHAEWIEVAN